MKAVYCTACGDFKALSSVIQADGTYEPTACRCGRCRGRWVDGRRGTALFTEVAGSVSLDVPVYIYLLGIHNDVLHYGRYDTWKDADGYQFKTEETMILRIRPGYSSDTRFVSLEEFEAGEWPTRSKTES